MTSYVASVQEKFNSFRANGFIDLSLFKGNPVLVLVLFCLGRSTGSYLQGIIEREERYAIYEVMHLHNLLLLLLILDLQLTANQTTDPELISDLDVSITSLKGKLSGPIRQFISMRRVSTEDRLYCGYDTEFEQQDNKESNLLCATLAAYRKVLVKVKGLEVDYSITNLANGDSRQEPKVASLLRTTGLLVRRASGRDDKAVDLLLKDARTEKGLEVLTARGATIIQYRHVITPEAMKACY